ncbi:MAG: hypothetical protein DRN17_08045 [Thermoplasmata archaeon]|nr:MAG: hypothetical protein DRN17_08045 [Thermoplasmata archaeon]
MYLIYKRKKMKLTKFIGASALIAAALTFTGCTQDQQNLAVAGSHSDGSHTDNYYHHGHDYGQNRNYGYQQGVREGCNSRHSGWDMDKYRYKHDYNYKAGWDAGYKRCRYK